MPYNRAARCPASPVYQVCECTTFADSAALAITRSADSVASAGLAPLSAGSGWWTTAPSRGAPMQCTSTSQRLRSCATSSVTWTPAPPYTSGGYSRVIIATRMPTTVVSDAVLRSHVGNADSGYSPIVLTDSHAGQKCECLVTVRTCR